MPTTRQVLRRVLHATQHSESRSEAFDLTMEEVGTFWEKAGIKTLGKASQKKKLTKLWEPWRGLQKSGQHADSETRERFNEQLDLLWNIAAPDWKDDILKNRLLTDADKEEDIAFFHDQCGARASAIRGLDSRYKSKVEYKNKRESRQEGEQEEESEETSKKPAKETGGSPEDMDVSDGAMKDEAILWTPDEHEQNQDRRQGGVQLTLPRDVLQQPAILEVADRFQITDRKVRISLSYSYWSCSYQFHLRPWEIQSLLQYIREFSLAALANVQRTF